MMHVSYFVPTGWKWPWAKQHNYNKVSASVWIRCFQLEPFFLKQGIKMELNAWNAKTRAAVFLRAYGAKHRKIAATLKRQGVKIFIDTPVNYFSDQNMAPFQGGAREDFTAMAEFADQILCPSEYIRDQGMAKGYKVTCIEDSLDMNHFKYKKEKKSNDRPSLIWSGIAVKADILNFLAGRIKRNNWKITVISEKKPHLDFEFKYVKWNYGNFPRDILQGNIGVFPRRLDNEYDLGHSSFKILPFLNANMPVACSPLPSYKPLLTDENSITVEDLSEDSWEKAIAQLINNLGDFSFDSSLIDKFSTENISLKYKNIFNEAI